MHELVLQSSDANRRFDKFLCQYFNAAPKSFVYKMLRKKRIKLNGGRATGNEIIQPGDKVVFYIAPETMAHFMAPRESPRYAKPLDIIYEDESILLVNKPAGLLTHAAERHQADTLTARLLFYLKQTQAWDDSKTATFTPAAANRLDRNTSGLVACGKTLAGAQMLSGVFAEGAADRRYWAVVQGQLAGSKELKGFYHKDEKNNVAHITENLVRTDSVPVCTIYEVLATTNDFSWLSVRLTTGKSHQIRAHLASIGHPLVGDLKYGGCPCSVMPAQLLHCYHLGFSGRSWRAPLPLDFQNAILRLFAGEGVLDNL